MSENEQHQARAAIEAQEYTDMLDSLIGNYISADEYSVKLKDGTATVSIAGKNISFPAIVLDRSGIGELAVALHHTTERGDDLVEELLLQLEFLQNENR